jgi:hypothetical protein
VEHVREVKITVYVDTNKTTYEECFDTIEEARTYLRGLVAWIYPSSDTEEDKAWAEVRQQLAENSDE